MCVKKITTFVRVFKEGSGGGEDVKKLLDIMKNVRLLLDQL
jgi:hypothetical protein